MDINIKRIFTLLIFITVVMLFGGCKSDDAQKAAFVSESSALNIISSTDTSIVTTALATTATTTTTSAATVTTAATTTVTTTTSTLSATTTTTTVTLLATTSSVQQTTTTTVTAREQIVGLYDAQSLEAIYENCADERIYPASLTKLLTACTALEYVSPDTVFTVGTELNLLNSGSSVCLINQGHSLTLYDLLTGMLVKSGNDAAYTIAVNVAREVSGNSQMGDSEAVQYFVNLMNDYAQQIGMESSNFANPDGWDDENQYTTVCDLAKIASVALENENIREIVALQSKYVVFASGQNITWTNTNALLNPESEYYCEDAIGMKTGTTPMAGKCLIAAFDVEGRIYIAISANNQSEQERYESILQMYDMLVQ